MKPLFVTKNPQFVGRKAELARLNELKKSKRANIIVVYGRRRVGKTELIEQFFQKDKILKFEGLQTDKQNKAAIRKYQLRNCLNRLSNYLEDPVLRKVRCDSWTDFFELLDPVVTQKKIVLYFEEIQWLSNYRSEFLAEIKPFWDDRWRHVEGFKMVFCGSAPSFIVGQFFGDKALYSRSQHEFHLKPFSLIETNDFFPRLGKREVMLAQLTVGGIPEYLKRIQNGSSILLNLCQESFLKGSFFLNEADRIYISSLSHNKHYRQIIKWLASRKHATRKEIQSAIKAKSGGTLTTVLGDLESLGFIEKYVPLHLEENSLVSRYTISDEYLLFYYKYIVPHKKKIENGQFIGDPIKGLPMSSFQKSLGFSFERWCRKNSMLFAKILGFDKIDYLAGAFFNRETDKQTKGFQIDLMYIRADSRIIICEIKHLNQLLNVKKIYRDVLQKQERFKEAARKYKNYTYEFALITTEGDPQLQIASEYFDHVISYKQIFDRKHWE